MGFLLPLPLAQTADWYLVEFGKSGCFIEEILSLISSSAQCAKEEAAECLIVPLFNKFEEPFVKVSTEKGLLQMFIIKWTQQVWRQCFVKQA
jgi:hypothetical protein